MKPKRDRKQSSSVTPLTSQALTEIPARALTFVRALAANPAIRSELAAHGYRADDHAEGLRLLLAVLEVPAADASWKPVPDFRREFLTFAHTKLRAVEIVLRRRHAAEHRRLFAGISVSDDAVHAAAIFLARCLDDLDAKGPVQATLATLGLPLELQRRLDMRVLHREGAGAKDARTDEGAVRALRDWLDTWASLAREVASSRESLIRLGLSSRRRGASGGTATGGEDSSGGVPH